MNYDSALEQAHFKAIVVLKEIYVLRKLPSELPAWARGSIDGKDSPPRLEDFCEHVEKIEEALQRFEDAYKDGRPELVKARSMMPDRPTYTAFGAHGAYAHDVVGHVARGLLRDISTRAPDGIGRENLAACHDSVVRFCPNVSELEAFRAALQQEYHEAEVARSEPGTPPGDDLASHDARRGRPGESERIMREDTILHEAHALALETITAVKELVDLKDNGHRVVALECGFADPTRARFQQGVDRLQETLAAYGKAFDAARPQLKHARRNLPERAVVTACGRSAVFAHDVLLQVAGDCLGMVRMAAGLQNVEGGAAPPIVIAQDCLPLCHMCLAARFPEVGEVDRLKAALQAEYIDAEAVADAVPRNVPGPGPLERTGLMPIFDTLIPYPLASKSLASARVRFGTTRMVLRGGGRR